MGLTSSRKFPSHSHNPQINGSLSSFSTTNFTNSPDSGLWGFLAAWRSLFDRFDEDHSGTISYQEYSNALLAFGYHLSPEFVLMLYRAYDKWGRNDMSFDIFVQSCISLKRMTDVFKKYDSDRDGFITLSFEDFLKRKHGTYCFLSRPSLS